MRCVPTYTTALEFVLEMNMHCVYTTTHRFGIQFPGEKSAVSDPLCQRRETAICTFHVLDLTQHAHQVSIHSGIMEKLGETRLSHRHQTFVPCFKRTFSATWVKTREKVGETRLYVTLASRYVLGVRRYCTVEKIASYLQVL